MFSDHLLSSVEAMIEDDPARVNDYFPGEFLESRGGLTKT